MISFRLDTRSGVSPYLQIVHQVKHALRLGMLQVGDQLPTIKEVVVAVAINPNTVVKAYRELEYMGLIESRAGLGTFVIRTLAGPSLASHATLRRSLLRWIEQARAAGLDEESIESLFVDTVRTSAQSATA